VLADAANLANSEQVYSTVVWGSRQIHRGPLTMIAPRRDQFSGCLIGQCLGDALGAPVEGQQARITAGYINAFLRTDLVGSFGRPGYQFGQYTDDSQLARELMQSYAACGQFDPEDYGRRIAAIFTSGRIVGPGAATANAAFRIAKGVPWQEAGMEPPSAGNGSAMRAAPVGLLFHDDIEQLIVTAQEQGWITHQDPRCSAGAVAIAGATALALQPGPVDCVAFLTQLAGWAGIIEPSFGEAIEQLKQWVALLPEVAVAFIAKVGQQGGFVDHWEGITPFVMGSVLWSLYAFLRTPEEYWQTICTAIWPGGDVDTTAAMAGAISGAHLGLAALPAELARRVTDQGTWGYGELVDLADRCFEIKMEGG
jgi:ADP-ribosylglycohydrolase